MTLQTTNRRVESRSSKAYCNVLADQLGLDPAGYAGHFNDAVLIETDMPWRKEVFREAGALPQEMIDLVAMWIKNYHETGVYGHRPLLIAPDEEYSQPGYRRVIYYERSESLFAHFDRQEYLVPEEQTGQLIWSLFEAKDVLSQFREYQVRFDQTGRDLLVCTHGTVDVACAKFGYPLYRRMRDAYAGQETHPDLRVWRVSHFGGHVFAPTLMDMPTGHYWAYVGEDQVDQIIERNGDVADLHGYYRGWAGLKAGFVQAAERAVWQREGWPWFDYRKSGEIVAQDSAEEPQWADVCISGVAPDGNERVYHVRVEVERTVETVPSTDHESTHAYLQYVVTSLT